MKDVRNEEQAACRDEDPELWFPEPTRGKKPRKRDRPTPRAIVVCGSCPIRRDCLAFALKHDMRYGIWGGVTEQQRRKITHPPRRRPQAPPPEPSDIRGVSWNSAKAKWVVVIRHGGKTHWVGTFDDLDKAEDAAVRKCDELRTPPVRRTGRAA